MRGEGRGGKGWEGGTKRTPASGQFKPLPLSKRPQLAHGYCSGTVPVRVESASGADRELSRGSGDLFRRSRVLVRVWVQGQRFNQCL